MNAMNYHTYKNLDIYFHMRNHYRRLKGVLPVVECTPAYVLNKQQENAAGSRNQSARGPGGGVRPGGQGGGYNRQQSANNRGNAGGGNNNRQGGGNFGGNNGNNNRNQIGGSTSQLSNGGQSQRGGVGQNQGGGGGNQNQNQRGSKSQNQLAGSQSQSGGGSKSQNQLGGGQSASGQNQSGGGQNQSGGGQSQSQGGGLNNQGNKSQNQVGGGQSGGGQSGGGQNQSGGGQSQSQGGGLNNQGSKSQNKVGGGQSGGGQSGGGQNQSGGGQSQSQGGGLNNQGSKSQNQIEGGQSGGGQFGGGQSQSRGSMNGSGGGNKQQGDGNRPAGGGSGKTQPGSKPGGVGGGSRRGSATSAQDGGSRSKIKKGSKDRSGSKGSGKSGGGKTPEKYTPIAEDDSLAAVAQLQLKSAKTPRRKICGKIPHSRQSTPEKHFTHDENTTTSDSKCCSKCECSPGNSATPREFKSSIQEHEYLQFALRITEDIIKNDLYSNAAMKRVFHSHMEANRDRLDKEKMTKQIEILAKELNIQVPDDSHALHPCKNDLGAQILSKNIDVIQSATPTLDEVSENTSECVDSNCFYRSSNSPKYRFTYLCAKPDGENDVKYGQTLPVKMSAESELTSEPCCIHNCQEISPSEVPASKKDIILEPCTVINCPQIRRLNQLLKTGPYYNVISTKSPAVVETCPEHECPLLNLPQTRGLERMQKDDQDFSTACGVQPTKKLGNHVCPPNSPCETAAKRCYNVENSSALEHDAGQKFPEDRLLTQPIEAATPRAAEVTTPFSTPVLNTDLTPKSCTAANCPQLRQTNKIVDEHVARGTENVENCYCVETSTDVAEHVSQPCQDRITLTDTTKEKDKNQLLEKTIFDSAKICEKCLQNREITNKIFVDTGTLTDDCTTNSNLQDQIKRDLYQQKETTSILKTSATQHFRVCTSTQTSHMCVAKRMVQDDDNIPLPPPQKTKTSIDFSTHDKADDYNTARLSLLSGQHNPSMRVFEDISGVQDVYTIEPVDETACQTKDSESANSYDLSLDNNVLNAKYLKEATMAPLLTTASTQTRADMSIVADSVEIGYGRSQVFPGQIGRENSVNSKGRKISLLPYVTSSPTHTFEEGSISDGTDDLFRKPHSDSTLTLTSDLIRSTTTTQTLRSFPMDITEAGAVLSSAAKKSFGQIPRRSSAGTQTEESILNEAFSAFQTEHKRPSKDVDGTLMPNSNDRKVSQDSQKSVDNPNDHRNPQTTSCCNKKSPGKDKKTSKLAQKDAQVSADEYNTLKIFDMPYISQRDTNEKSGTTPTQCSMSGCHPFVQRDSLPLIKKRMRSVNNSSVKHPSFDDEPPPDEDTLKETRTSVFFGSVETVDSKKQPEENPIGVSIATQSRRCDVDLKPEKDLPTFNLPNSNLPNFNLPNFDLPNSDLPNFDLPNSDLPKYDLPNFVLPNFDLPTFEASQNPDKSNFGEGLLLGDEYTFRGGLPPILLQFFPSVTTQTSSTDFLLIHQDSTGKCGHSDSFYNKVDDGKGQNAPKCSSGFDAAQQVDRQADVAISRDSLTEDAVAGKSGNGYAKDAVEPEEKSSLNKQVTIAEQSHTNNRSSSSHMDLDEDQEPDDVTTGFLDMASTSMQKKLQDAHKQNALASSIEVNEGSAARLSKRYQRNSLSSEKRVSLTDDAFMKRLDHKTRLSITPSMDQQINKFVSEGETFRHPERKTADDNQKGIDLTNVAQYLESAEENEDDHRRDSATGSGPAELKKLSKSDMPRLSGTKRSSLRD